MVARLLRTDIREVLIGNLGLIDAKELGVVAIAVVLHRSASIVLHAVVGLWHLELHAVAEHRGDLGLVVGIELLADDNLALSGEGVSKLEGGLDGRQFESSLSTVVFDIQLLEFHLRALPDGEALLEAGTVVIIRRGAPELWQDGVTVEQHGLAIDIEIVDESRPLADGQRGTCGSELEIADGLLLGDAGRLDIVGEDGELIRLDAELLAGKHLTLVDEGLCLAAAELEVDENLGIGMMFEYTSHSSFELGIGDELALLGSDARDIDGATMTADGPNEFEVVEALEEVLVIDLKLAFLQIFLGDPYILVIVAHLVSMWIETTIGGNDTIAVEVVVAGGIASVVATIGEDLLTRDGTLVAKALINEVPDVATLILGVLADDIPVLLEATHRVTHRVGVLTLDERTGIVALGVFHAVFIAQVHRTEDIGLAVLTSLFELTGTRLVVGLHPVVGPFEVRSVASLVAE